MNEQTEFTHYTALHFAAQNNTLAVVIMLLNAGALINAKDVNEETPLHYAAKREEPYYQEDPAVITALIAAGADHTRLTSLVIHLCNWPRERSDSREFVRAFGAEAVAAFREEQRKDEAAARKQEVEQQLRDSRVSCEKWNTASFFRNAGVADIPAV